MNRTLTRLSAQLGIALALALPAAAMAAPPGAEAGTASKAAKPKAAALPAQELTPQILYEMVLAEIAGARGEVDISTKLYLDLARRTRDPRVARRATEIALFARNMEAATEAARIWSAADPSSEDARRVLAGALASADGNLDEVQTHLARILAENGDHLDPNLMGLNRALAGVSDKKAVRQMVERLTAPYLDHPSAHFARAQAALATDDTAAAIAAADEALEVEPDWEPAVLLKAQVLEQTHATAGAVKLLGDYSGRHPDDRGARLAYARALVADQQYEPAREAFARLLADMPEDRDLLYAVGLLSAQVAKFDEAEGYLERALAAGHPDADGIRMRLAQLAERRNASAVALERYQAVGEGRYHFEAQLAIARLLASEGKLDQAREHLRAQKPADEMEKKRLLVAEAQLLRDANRGDEALTLVDEALRKSPDDTDLLYESAMIAERLGRIEVMEGRLRKLIALDPDNAHARNALGYSLADRGLRLDEAESLIQKALQLAPDDPFILDSMGWVRFRQGDAAGALPHLERAYHLRPDPEIAAHLGEVLWSMRRRDDAKRVWGEGLKADPKNGPLLETVHRLAP